jgi:uncharacterized repeat protein (TIGR01451 family)
MRFKWLIPGALTVMALLLVILFSQGAGQAQEPLADLIVTKSVSPSVIAPGEMVVYSVVLSNTTGVTLEVSSLVDTLPDGFEYAGLAPGNQWDVPPWDTTSPDIQWAGPITVPAAASLTINYWIWVSESIPLSGEPYTNTVVADLNGETYQAEAGLLVGVGEVSIDKMADPLVVEPGESVTYTIAFSNSGYVPVPLVTVTDLLPSGVTFVRMTADSDVPDEPAGDTGEIEWTGPFTIDPRTEFVVEYVAAMPLISDTVDLENQAWGQLGDGTELGPASKAVRVVASEPMTVVLPLITRHWAPPVFTVAKTAEPTTAYAETPGELITYTVVFVNEGTVAGTLVNIRDALPVGFTFVQMIPGSDVSDPPSGSTGLIVWAGPHVVDGGSSLTLIFQVRASSVPGTYVNYATATALDGRAPAAPAQATVQLLAPILLSESWESPSPYWEPFLNYWRLNEEQWHYKPGGSYDGSTALAHTYWFGVGDPEDGAHDALFMYKDPAAEQWTDYSFRTRAILYFDDGSNRGQFGLWFRGIHRDSDLGGRWVTGYYFSLKPASSVHAYLWQLRTDDECGDDCNYNYHFSNPLLLEALDRDELEAKGVYLEMGRWYWLRVDVEGPRIRCYVDDHLVFDYYDDVGSVFTEGTVGFVTYIAGDARFDNVTVEPLE